MAAILLTFFAFAGIITVVVLVAVRGTERANARELRSLGRALGLPDGSPFLVERHGRAFTAKYSPGGRHTPPSLRITACVDETAAAALVSPYREVGREYLSTRPAIVMRRETWKDRLGKRLGLNREIQTGDAEFDADVYLETDSPEQDVRRTLAGAGIHHTVRRLLGSGVVRVHLDPGGLSAVLVGRSPDVGNFEHIAGLLAPIAAALPVFQAGQATEPRSKVPGSVVVVAFLLLGTLAIGAARGPAPLDSGAQLVGIGGGLVLWIVVTLASTLLLRGRSDSLRQIGGLAFATLLGIPAGTYRAACWANQALDTSPGVDHPTTITKSTTYYHVDVASWRQGEAAVSLSVSPAFANSATKGRGILVTTHAGRLGWEWVDTFHLAPKVPVAGAP